MKTQVILSRNGETVIEYENLTACATELGLSRDRIIRSIIYGLSLTIGGEICLDWSLKADDETCAHAEKAYLDRYKEVSKQTREFKHQQKKANETAGIYAVGKKHVIHYPNINDCAERMKLPKEYISKRLEDRNVIERSKDEYVLYWED